MTIQECIKQMRQSQWISAQDRMPDVEGSYIICTDRGAVCSAHYYPQKSRWNNPYNGHVLCWQPMPEPPDLTEWDEWMEAQKQEG